MAILFHPAHRKFIKLLRSYADQGVIIKITNQDMERFYELIHRTDNALERHRSGYRLLLEILNRKTPSYEGYPFTNEMVDKIEHFFARSERRKPCVTFQGVVIVPILQALLQKLKSVKRN